MIPGRVRFRYGAAFLGLGNLPLHNARIQILNFTWDDLGPLARLCAALHGGTVGSGAGDADLLRRELQQPRVRAEEDVFLAWEGQDLVGYAQVAREDRISRAVMSGGVSPDRRRQGAGRRLLEQGVAYARRLRFHVLDADIPSSNEAAKGLLVSAGFAHVRTYARYGRDAQGSPRIPVAEGDAVRLVRPSEMEALTELQNAAFAGSWGYCPNVPEEVRYSIFELHPKPDPVLVLERGGELIAYCWCHEEGRAHPGMVGMVGVAPRYRGMGLGSVVVSAAIDHLVALGADPLELTVDGENTPAVRLYEGLGFRRGRAVHWYELQLGQVTPLTAARGNGGAAAD